MQRKFIFEGGYSKRYHVVSTLKEQNIAAHSFGVAWLCEIISDGRASKNLVMAALSHDLSEHIVGDVPSPAKRALNIGSMYQAIEEKTLLDNDIVYHVLLTDEEKLTLKFADMFEGLLFCLRERKFGNQHIEDVYDRFHNYIEELLSTRVSYYSNEVMALLTEINNEWKEVINA